MDRIAFTIGKINIYWYAIMICIGMLLAIFLGVREAKRHKINMDFFINMVFYMILFGIIGTRLYYVLFNLDYYLQNPADIFKVWNGGLAIHGGVITGILVIIIYTKKYRVNTLKMLDISAVSVKLFNPLIVLFFTSLNSVLTAPNSSIYDIFI
jgi:phosphatidylglycerol:prolipoprotein diacylglycerol transferase